MRGLTKVLFLISLGLNTFHKGMTTLDPWTSWEVQVKVFDLRRKYHGRRYVEQQEDFGC